MAKIVRTPTKASGGITPAEREQMRAVELLGYDLVKRDD